MQFRTEITIPASPDKITLGHSFLTVGSCFAQVIGQKLAQHKLDTLNNPFGTIFNPISQFELILAALAPEEQEELPLVQQNGRWFAYNFHSSFSATTKQELQQQIDVALSIVRDQIEKADTIIFTFGTAMVYQLADSDRIVANCHKVPQSNFSRRFLLSEEIVTSFAEMFALIKSVNQKVRIILTVSPVRHVKETLVLNSVSKSVLRVACHYLAEMLPEVDYFPAYELLMDDLRDYRFYKDDMLHPTEMAEQYVWQKFGEVYFDQQLQKFSQEWSRIQQALAHKPFQLDSEAHQHFLHQLLLQLQQLNHTVNVEAEIAQVKQQLMPVRRNQLKKKASAQLVSLLENLAASEVMAEESRSSDTSDSEAFVWPDQEEDAQPVAAAPDAPEEQPEGSATTADNKEEAEEPPKEEPTPEPVQAANQEAAPAPFVHTKKSKSKKRREKRKAKLMASRGNAKATSEPVEPTAEAQGQAPEAAEAGNGNAPANQPETAKAQRPVKKARNNSRKSRENAAPEATQAEQTNEAPANERTNQIQEPSLAASDNRPDTTQNEPAKPAPVRKKPGRKPAAAVGALLNSLGQSKATDAAANPAKPATAEKPTKTEKPAKKEKAAKPAKADKIQKPAKPARAEKPAKPTKSASTEQPEKSAKPARAVRAPRNSVKGNQTPAPTPDAASERNNTPALEAAAPLKAASAAKPKRTYTRKPKSNSNDQELPFTPANEVRNAQAPAQEQSQPVKQKPDPQQAQQQQQHQENQPAKPQKENKPRENRKENGGSRKGKAKKVVLQKSNGGKGNGNNSGNS